MKTTACVLSLLAAVLAPACAGGLTVGVDLGVSPQLGLAFNSAFDPGYSGTALEAAVLVSSGVLRGEAGVEAGGSPIGWQVLLPIRGGLTLPLPPFSFDLLAEAAPGVALFKPAPLFMIGAGALGRVVWQISPGFGLYLSVGARCTLCPAYRQFTGVSYASLDLPAAAGIRLVFR